MLDQGVKPIQTIHGFIGMLICVVLIIIILFLHSQSSNCGDSLTETGFLNGAENNGWDLIIDNQSWYVSDYFVPGGNMPDDFSKYFNHNVEIEYTAGCGRCMILDIKTIDEYDWTFCEPIFNPLEG